MSNTKITTQITEKLSLELYKALLKPRLIEEKMLSFLRQGKISKWFSGIGQEAISVGCTMALQPDDYIMTMHRNLGVFTSRGIGLDQLYAQWQGKEGGFTKGRDRSFHFGDIKHSIVGMISHLGPQLSVACGTALAARLQDNKKVTLAFTGEGGTSQGEFHEALNVASVWQLPVIFVIENNGYGLSTPTNEQYHCKDLADRALGYGMDYKIIDGNDIEEVYSVISKISKAIRKDPKPWLIECKTFRMRGHEEASGTKYVPTELMEEWAKRDPLENYEKKLIQKGVISKKLIASIRKEIIENINNDLDMAEALPDVSANKATEIQDVFAPSSSEVLSPKNGTKELRFIDAINEGIDEAMKKHSSLVIMGQDIAEYGGVFKVTQGIAEKYGNDRVRNTPLCESAIIGTSLGLSISNIKSIVEMQFADFVTCGFNQIINNLAKIHYRWGQNADVVIRMPTGAGVGAGPFHSQSNEAWFFHTPGIKIVYPSNPTDAKGLLLAAVDDPNPVMFFEHKVLYRKLSEPVPEGYYHIEIGKGNIVREGSKVSLITYGMGVHWAKDIVQKNDWDVEILDLRSLAPLDYDAIEKTTKKTGRVLILHEDSLIGGIGGEISAYITENFFEYLDAPVIRVASMDTPIPFSSNLEDQYLAKSILEVKLNLLYNY
jgi:2-oxoisovalerate dehydrogenase E1 component